MTGYNQRRWWVTAIVGNDDHESKIGVVTLQGRATTTTNHMPMMKEKKTRLSNKFQQLLVSKIIIIKFLCTNIMKIMSRGIVTLVWKMALNIPRQNMEGFIPSCMWNEKRHCTMYNWQYHQLLTRGGKVWCMYLCSYNKMHWKHAICNN